MTRINVTVIGVLILLIATAGLVVVLVEVDIKALIECIGGWISSMNNFAPLIFILLYVAGCLFLVPGSILTLSAGVLFGVVEGTVLAMIGSTIGAGVAFLAGRYFIHDWVQNKISRNPKFKAIGDAVAYEGWKIVLLTRLSPVFPFSLINYCYGLTKIRFKGYILASMIGMLPGTTAYVYAGALAKDVFQLDSSSRPRTLGEWIISGVGLLATVVVVFYITRIAKRTLELHLPKTQD